MNITECCLCGKKYDNSRYRGIRNEICPKCYEKGMFTCSICHKKYNWSKSVIEDAPGKEVWCIDCAKKKGVAITRCDNCNKEYPWESISFVDGYTVCPACYKKKVWRCRRCKEPRYRQPADKENKICIRCIYKDEYAEWVKKTDFSTPNMNWVTAYWLKRNSARDIMTALRRGYEPGRSIDEGFDALEIITGYRCSLLVVNVKMFEILFLDPRDILGNIAADYTMTEFKRDNVAFEESSIEHELIEIREWDKTHNLEIWSEPILLRAQTWFDMDYRKEWNGEDLVYEGNNYGDTSSFLIIGGLVNKTK